MTKSYKLGSTQTIVFNDVTLTIPTDRRVAILGGENSGKTTLINLLAGAEGCTGGAVKRFATLSFPIGAIRGMKSHYSARQNIDFSARIFGVDVKEVRDFVVRVMGAELIMDEPLIRLPIQTRMALSYALGYAIPFDAYLFDNSVAFGSARFRETCLEMFQARSEKSGMILATRQARLAQQLCDFAIVIEAKKMTVFTDINEAVSQFNENEARKRRLAH